MIQRKKKTSNFTVIDNGLINDRDISLKALGTLVFILSKPDHWQTSIAGLSSQRKEGKDSIRTSLKELRDAGYLEMKKRADGSVDYLVSEEKSLNRKTQNRVFPNRENPTQVNTDIEVSTEESEYQPPQEGTAPQLELVGSGQKKASPTNRYKDEITDIVTYLNVSTGSKFKASSEATAKSITALLKAGHQVDDFRSVIDKKCGDWLDDDKMSQYLRPSTLFRKSKFEEYLEQIEAQAPAAQREPRCARCNSTIMNGRCIGCGATEEELRSAGQVA